MNSPDRLRWLSCAGALILLLLVGCPNQRTVGRGRTGPVGVGATTEPAIDRDQVTQISIINALLLSRYDGVAPVGELLKYGDFGLGTFDHLDGEMIVLDGVVWQAKADGAVVRCDPAMTTPFAVVTSFDADETFPLPQADSLEALDAALDERLGSLNAFVAIGAAVEFEELTLRSVPRQEPPYRPLAEVTKDQTVWTHQNISGVLVGLRCPSWVTGVNVPGYHWHFLSDDQRVGGHIIDAKVRQGTASIDRCGSWLVELDSVASDSQDLGQDLSRQLDQVERQRGGE